MTTYETLGYETSEDLRNAINSDLAALAYPFAVKHRTYGEGQLTFVKAPLTGGSLYATIDFAAGTKTLSLDIVLANNLLEMPEILLDTLLELQTTFKADFIEREEAQRLADREAWTQARDAARKAEAEKKAEVKYEATKETAIKNFEALVQTPQPKSFANEFYYSLGWLAKHVGTVSASLPDYLESSFSKHFGTNTGARIVDSKKRTINGNSMQWTFGFTATLRKPENMPAYLQQYLSTTGKAIANTTFIWDLVDNYGFKFGKKQDVEEIQKHVPIDKLDVFKAGYEA